MKSRKKITLTKLKKALTVLLLGVFIYLGAVLCVYYATVFAKDTHYTMQLILSVICAAEAVSTTASLVFLMKENKESYVKKVNGLSFVLCLQVSLFVIMWMAYYLGINV